MIVGVDHGNSFIKTQNFVFPSGLTEKETKPPVSMVKEFIEYEGKYYTLTNSNRLSYERDKTKNDNYFVLTLFAVLKELCKKKPLTEWEGTSATVTLAVGLPPLHYDQLKDVWKKYFIRKGIKLKYNDVPLTLTIDKVYVFVQGFAGAVVYGAKKIADLDEVCVIDIGGYTTDVLMLYTDDDGIRIDMEHFMSLEEGVIKMMDSCIDEISAKYDLKVKESHFEKIFRGEKTLLPDEVVQYIKQEIAKQAKTILSKLRQKGIDLKTMPALFIGGGSIVFRDVLENSDMVVKPIFVNDQKANAIGYYKLALAARRAK